MSAKKRVVDILDELKLMDVADGNRFARPALAHRAGEIWTAHDYASAIISESATNVA